MLDQLDAWATEEIPLPESRVPSRLFLQDYGPDFTQGFITHEPPRVDTTLEYAVLIPSVDADGNNIPGLCTPDITVPLATYTGWKLRAEGYGSQAMYSVVGSYIPFAATEAERQAEQQRFAWVPFGAGQHMCVGTEFALMTGPLILAQVLQRYKVTSVPGHPFNICFGTNVRPDGGGWVHLERGTK